jgi:hypothetical protein
MQSQELLLSETKKNMGYGRGELNGGRKVEIDCLHKEIEV